MTEQGKNQGCPGCQAIATLSRHESIPSPSQTGCIEIGTLIWGSVKDYFIVGWC